MIRYEFNINLSGQVASSVERPAAEGEEAVNGHSEVNHTQQVLTINLNSLRDAIFNEV